ncbi:Zinc finger, CCCH-type [Dillenia turbinata]|uniref:Zinc finger, CCCH-type n=1 Tax=Dillenia turbinata TaxID=194707 RepID=A0AAN8VDM4_9MAGN
MQKESSTASGGVNGGQCITSPSSTQSHNQLDGLDFSSLYYSVFSPQPSLHNSTPSDYSTDEENTNTAIDNGRLYHPSLILNHQDLIEHHNMCLTQLDALRRENTTLKLLNRDLTERMHLLIQACLQNRFLNNHTTGGGYESALAITNELRRLSVGENSSGGGGGGGVSGGAVVGGGVWDDLPAEMSPTSVIESDQMDRLNASANMNRTALPKSISVRSSGYLKMSQAGGSNSAGPARATNRVRSASGSDNGTRVFVKGGKKEESGLELEVYAQGMFKTELCNKWQETGACPYGNHCQFAHGIGELRPVIRHPRYKTEVCRMVLSGDACPYGHRCHFRHSITDQDRLLGPP